MEVDELSTAAKAENLYSCNLPGGLGPFIAEERKSVEKMGNQTRTLHDASQKKDDA